MASFKKSLENVVADYGAVKAWIARNPYWATGIAFLAGAVVDSMWRTL